MNNMHVYKRKLDQQRKNIYLQKQLWEYVEWASNLNISGKSTFIFEMNLGHESGDQVGSYDKNPLEVKNIMQVYL